MYEVRLADDAKRHLAAFPARDQRVVLDAIDEQLQHQPTVVTRNRKPLRENPLAEWELRVQRYRVLYNVAEESVTVIVIAIAVKAGNRFNIEGEEYSL
ncbi:MAG: type II toxin-antitoxin system RelE/ParE family toxin [Planctomycetes bacterium]|nr:type II toxin-antitoxin system RelE/ParE family toxin [Planctomycetota bacterium]